MFPKIQLNLCFFLHIHDLFIKLIIYYLVTILISLLNIFVRFAYILVIVIDLNIDWRVLIFKIFRFVTVVALAHQWTQVKWTCVVLIYLN